MLASAQIKEKLSSNNMETSEASEKIKKFFMDVGITMDSDASLLCESCCVTSIDHS